MKSTAALLFGLLHIDPVQMCYTFVLGIILHYVYLCTRSLLEPMMLHIGFNLLGFGTYKMTIDEAIGFNSPDENLWIPLSLVAASLVAVAGLCFLLRQSRVQFHTLDDAIWSPGYDTAAMPPSCFRATVVQNVPGLLSVIMATGSCLVFGLVLGYTLRIWFDPGNAWAHFTQAVIFAEQEEYEEAVAAYTKAIEGDPGLADAYFGRGEAGRLLEQFDHALLDHSQGLWIDPESAWGHAERGETYRQLEMTDDALADSNRAIELDPQLAWGYTIRGAVHSDRGDSALAIADFTKSISLDDEHSWTCELLAWELTYSDDEHLRDFRAAIRCATIACELTDWSDLDALETLANAYERDGEVDLAERYRQEAQI